MWRRFAVLVAVLALVAVACGGTEADEETTTTTTTQATDDTDAGQTDGESTLDVVKARGQLICGTNETLPGFGFREPDGSFSGLDVDFCRAIAAAVFGDANAVEFVPLTAAARFTALQTGEIDVLIRNTTWTQSRDVTLGADFAPTTFYDGQGIMARGSDGFDDTSTVEDLEGAVVCTNAGTTTELNISEAARVAGVNIDLQTSEDFDQVMAAFQAGSCDVVTTDKSGLISRKAVAEPADFREDLVIFGVTLSKEPLGPMFRANDSVWGDVVDWTVYATLIAEEKGINSGNIDSILGSTDDGEALRLFGRADDEIQTAMGLDADAFYNVISQVGNYGEIYDRNLGPDTVFNVPRGLNQLWTNGGLMYPPPAR
jgi:general L-amino acid transport system substrate-binding protein